MSLKKAKPRKIDLFEQFLGNSQFVKREKHSYRLARYMFSMSECFFQMIYNDGHDSDHHGKEKNESSHNISVLLMPNGCHAKCSSYTNKSNTEHNCREFPTR